jgi:nucleoside-diphosphate-sugar epimerase
MYNVNVLGTENLLEACKNFDFIKKIILASSATVYGNQDIDTYHEELCPNPVNHYGISKYAMEQIAKNYFKTLPLIITRPFNYSAPGQSTNFIIPKIADAFRTRRADIELGNLHTYREYNSIEFICNAYYELLISDVKSEIFNLSSGKTYSLNEILTIFKEITNHEIKILINSKFVRNNEITKLAGNCEKLESILKNESSNNIRSIIKSFLS